MGAIKNSTKNSDKHVVEKRISEYQSNYSHVKQREEFQACHEV